MPALPRSGGGLGWGLTSGHDRYLRGVLLPDSETVHSSFMDEDLLPPMKTSYDRATDSLYIELRPLAATRTIELEEDVMLDLG
jgi:hypothetical protein